MADLQEVLMAAIAKLAIAESNRDVADVEYKNAVATLHEAEEAVHVARGFLSEAIEDLVQSIQGEENSDG